MTISEKLKLYSDLTGSDCKEPAIKISSYLEGYDKGIKTSPRINFCYSDDLKRVLLDFIEWYNLPFHGKDYSHESNDVVVKDFLKEIRHKRIHQISLNMNCDGCIYDDNSKICKNCCRNKKDLHKVEKEYWTI